MHSFGAKNQHCATRLQATWAELVRRLGVSNFEKNYIFVILMKNCTKYQSAIKIRDVAGTPNEDQGVQLCNDACHNSFIIKTPFSYRLFTPVDC